MLRAGWRCGLQSVRWCPARCARLRGGSEAGRPDLAGRVAGDPSERQTKERRRLTRITTVTRGRLMAVIVVIVVLVVLAVTWEWFHGLLDDTAPLAGWLVAAGTFVLALATYTLAQRTAEEAKQVALEASAVTRAGRAASRAGSRCRSPARLSNRQRGVDEGTSAKAPVGQERRGAGPAVSVEGLITMAAGGKFEGHDSCVTERVTRGWRSALVLVGRTRCRRLE